MQQAGHLRDRVMREIDTALALNAEQMAGGACETMEQYKYMVVVNEALKATADNVNKQFDILKQAVLGNVE